MTIISNGVDIVKNSRISKALKKNNFKNKIFSNSEIEQSKKYKNKTNYFAKRFAAKEAFYKALGTGVRYNFSFKDVTIKNNKLGKPYIIINNNVKKKILKLLKLKKMKIHLSLSDEKKYSIAFVILDKIYL